MVLCCLFLVSEFRWRFTLRVFILFLVRFRLLSGHLFLVIAAHSVDHMFSFVFQLFVILVISRFGGWIWDLIASVPDLCILFSFIKIRTSS